jgi:hypothetical protein
MRAPELCDRIVDEVLKEHDRFMVIDGYEPEVVIYREELDLLIPIKSIDFENGRVRIKI